MLRSLVNSLYRRSITKLPSLDPSRTLITLGDATAPLGTGTVGVAIAFGSNLVGYYELVTYVPDASR